MARNSTGWFFFLQSVQKWQEQRAKFFNEASAFDPDKEIRKQAGAVNLNRFSNDYEVQTLCELLNTDFETILNTDDTFCTKILLSNLEKITFEKRFSELKQKKVNRGSRK